MEWFATVLRGRLKLAETILGSSKFRFDNKDDIRRTHEDEEEGRGNGLILTNRTFTKALGSCDGTKQDFLDNWNRNCNSNKKQMIETILANYKDVDDKANDALKQDTESNVFGTKKDAVSTVKSFLDELED